jgi:8-hydroxy-5-deazaflavin:NADPH oxidoreductase
MEQKPTVGIIGKGHAGTALATGLRKAGYPVETSGRDPARVEQVARISNVVILAVPASERKDALKKMGDGIRGKTVVDVTNNVTKDDQYGGDLKSSLAEDTQKHAKEANVVKAFNTVFAENLSTGKVAGESLTLFVAGNDPAAKRVTEQMGEAIGFEVVDAGPLEAARWLEAVGFFQMRLGREAHLGTNIGLRVSGMHRTGSGSPSGEPGSPTAPTGPTPSTSPVDRASLM